MKPYNFNKQLNKGKAGEWVMDKYHAPFYHIQKATLSEEKQSGYDRLFRRNGRKYNVEIKTDYLCQKWGNLIPETWSVEESGIDGWARTSYADILIWYIWYFNEVLYFNMPHFKSLIDGWASRYGETARIPNEGYTTVGIKLPVDEARQSTFAIRKPIDPYWMKENYKTWEKVNHA